MEADDGVLTAAFEIDMAAKVRAFHEQEVVRKAAEEAQIQADEALAATLAAENEEEAPSEVMVAEDF